MLRLTHIITKLGAGGTEVVRQRRALGRRDRRRVGEHFSVGAMTEQYASLYDELARPATAGHG